jgi:hypothetical protein
MRDGKHFLIAGLVIAALFASYLGAYFLTAEYIDVGSNRPMYLVRYRVGSISLYRFASFFEPARRIDDCCFRGRNGTVMDFGTP